MPPCAAPCDGPVGDMLEALGRHPWRPAHLHFLIKAPRYETLITHVFRSDDSYLDSDAVFGVRQSLIADWKKQPDGTYLVEYGSVLGNVGMALHHKLCHTLGGSFNLPHAEVHTVILPHAMAFNSTVAHEAMVRIERALGVTGRASAAAALFDLARDNGAPVALIDIGMKANELDKAAKIAVGSPYWNPRPIGAAQFDAVRRLLQDAFEGVRPR